MKNETIQEALGLEESFPKLIKNLLDQKFEELERISDIMETAAEEVRNDDLGEVNVKLSTYEKKLVFLGMMIGARKVGNDVEGFLSSSILGSIIKEQKKKRKKDDEDGE